MADNKKGRITLQDRSTLDKSPKDRVTPGTAPYIDGHLVLSHREAPWLLHCPSQKIVGGHISEDSVRRSSDEMSRMYPETYVYVYKLVAKYVSSQTQITEFTDGQPDLVKDGS